jgi:hypothetical protein
MKKIAIVAAAFALALGLAGCKIDLGDTVNGNQHPVETPTD